MNLYNFKKTFFISCSCLFLLSSQNLSSHKTNNTTFPIDKIRENFPFTKTKMNEHTFIYLDSAATAQKPLPVIQEMNNFYINEYATVHRSLYEKAKNATNRFVQTRFDVQKFINAKYPEEIVFTRGTTDSINLVAMSFGRKNIKKDDEIIISETEHHSNIVPWQLLCKEKGAKLTIIPVDDNGVIKMNKFNSLLNNKVKLVCIAHIANSTGIQHPINEIIKKAHKKNAKVLIDGAQAAAHIPIDVQKSDADFYVFSGHKMYGPTGIGVLYAKKHILEDMPPVQGGGEMIEVVTLKQSSFAPPPLRFEAGTPMIVEAIGLSAAIKYIKQIGQKEIVSYEKSLTEYAHNKIKQIPNLKVIGSNSKNRGSIISFIVEGIPSHEIGAFLDKKGIAIRTGCLCSQPTMERFKINSTARISFGMYNTKKEIDYFLSSLKEAIDSIEETKN